MTVAELRVRMSTAEYAEWIGYHQWKAEKEKQEMDKASRGSR